MQDLPEEPGEKLREAADAACGGLGKAGAALWREMNAQFTFHAGELQILKQACAATDEIALLEASIAELGAMIPGSRGQMRLHPAFAQLATHRATVDRLMQSLALPVDGEQVGRRRSPQAKQAANVRWKSQARKGRIGTAPAQAAGGES
jgi:hypothetical protein